MVGTEAFVWRIGVRRGESQPHCHPAAKVKMSKPRLGQIPAGGGESGRTSRVWGSWGELKMVPDDLVSASRGRHVGLRIPCLQGASLQKPEARGQQGELKALLLSLSESTCFVMGFIPLCF